MLFYCAETTTKNFGEGRLLDEMDEDDLDQDAVLPVALLDRDFLISRPLTPDSNRGDGDDLRLGDLKKTKTFWWRWRKGYNGDIGTRPECKTRCVGSTGPKFTVLFHTRLNYGGR